ncbi:aminoglycoside 6-adenylyltransferase [Sporosarcina ureilytica]|uniref:Polymerase nucleotidyl transferase domain-containing protein n=1 Tax=Sporosarcina ureilytica TaxID=298596 RepID=A0A1D8JDF8_9BACL|nr:aminoglycoside 6-adenylyltransferase [Sporosarcina ureilytica]AOV06745.1 hypothetical protein BI350_03485 [Sporosarcina ureilytica]
MMDPSKHVQRDARISLCRQEIKEAIEQDLAGDPGILAVFYGGSIGNGDADQYSTIDLRIVVADEAFDQFWANKQNRAGRWGNVLFFEEVPHANYSTAHYEQFVKVDIFYYRLKDILPSFWLRNIEVFYDSSGMLVDIIAKSRQLTYKPSVKEIDLWRTKFFAYLHEWYRGIMRSEYYYALNCLDSLRLFMAMGWYMDAGIQPNALGDWAKIEGRRSPLQSWQLDALASWDSSRNPDHMIIVVPKVVEAFKKVHQSLCAKVGLDEDRAWVENIIRKVL